MIATDPSAEQLRQAPRDHRIEWRAATAEQSTLEPGSIDAITVAQALHWFDLPRFWTEARRVLRPRGVLVVWSYGIASLEDPGLSAGLRRFHDVVVGPYWPVERGHVDARYRDITIPFAPLAPPALDLRAEWTSDQLLGYVRTWSAVKRYVAANGHDPVDDFARRLEPRWGEEARQVIWPLTILAGRAAD